MNNIEKHKQICAELAELYTAKNADYGDSFHKSFEKYGLTMAAIRLGDKMLSETRSDYPAVAVWARRN